MFDVPATKCCVCCVASEYKYCRIDGNTPHETRQDLIEEYNAPVRFYCGGMREPQASVDR